MQTLYEIVTKEIISTTSFIENYKFFWLIVSCQHTLNAKLCTKHIICYIVSRKQGEDKSYKIFKESLLEHRARVATVVKLLINFSSLLLRVHPSLVSFAVFLVVPVF